MSVQDFGDYTITTTVTPNGETVTVAWKPGTAGANQQTLYQRAQTALSNNAAALALPAPSYPLSVAAQQQLVSQVQALTRQVDALILFLLGQFTDISST